MSKAELAITFQNVNKWFDDFQVLKDINLDIKVGEKIVICGPSGSGKSTLVRCINSLEVHQSGIIKVEGTEINSTNSKTSYSHPEVGMVFQQFNLFPHLTVKENLILGPMKARGLNRKDAENVRWHYWRELKFRSKLINIQVNYQVVNNSGSQLPAHSAWNQK